MSEKPSFTTVEEIPKIERAGAGKAKSKYDELYDAIKQSPIGTKAKIEVPRNEAMNYASALRSRAVKEGLKALQLMMRNVEREKTKSSSGKEYYKTTEADLYFLREEPEE